MVYDPSRPPPPPGQMGITSVPNTGGVQGLPTQIPQIPLGGANTAIPSTSSNPGQRPAPSGGGGGGFSMPNIPQLPDGFQIPQTPQPPAATPNLGAVGPNLPAMGGFAGGQMNIDGLRAFIDNYRNSIFEWLQGRPQDPTGMGAWAQTRPQFDVQGLRTALFAPPPAPTPVATTPPVI